MSAAKNFQRLKHYREGGDLAATIKDCDELAQYDWAVRKFQHHAVKMVDYNRPVLDFALTCQHNLQRWEKRFADSIDGGIQALQAFLSADGGDNEAARAAHIASCGRFYKQKRFNFFRSTANTADLSCRKSKHCYGPLTGVSFSHARRPLDLTVDLSRSYRQKHRYPIRKLVEKLDAEEIHVDEDVV